MWAYEDYLPMKEELIRYIKKNTIDEVSEYCVMVGLPLVVAYEYILDEMIEHKDVCEFKIKSLSHFYKL